MIIPVVVALVCCFICFLYYSPSFQKKSTIAKGSTVSLEVPVSNTNSSTSKQWKEKEKEIMQESAKVVEIEVGKMVRVNDSNKKKSFRALVLTVDQETVEVLLVGKDGSESELLVNKSQLQDLEPFEVKGTETIVLTETVIEKLERLKGQARVLFMKHDFEAANELYGDILKYFSYNSSTTDLSALANEAHSLIIKDANRLYVATIEGIKSDERILVSLDSESSGPIEGEGEEDEDEMKLISTNAIVVIVPKEHEEIIILVSVLLNQARCFIALNLRDQSIWKSTCVLKLVSRGVGASSSDWSNTSACTAYFLRAKAHAQSEAPRSVMKALRDAKRALELNPQQKEVTRLIKELEKREAIILKADRKLARQIGEWTEQALDGSKRAEDVNVP